MLKLDERLLNTPAQWEYALSQLRNSIRVAIPGIVQSFDSATQTVSVQPVTNELVYTDWQEEPVNHPLPLIDHIPVVLPRAGGFTLAMPIQQGDECLIVFADMDTSAWFQSGGTQNNQILLRRHNLSDAFAVIGTWSQPRVLENYPASAAQLRSDDGDTVVEVGNNEITIKAQTVNVQASGTATVQGQTVNVTGSNQVNISGNGHTSIEGKDFLTHTHSGVASGGATTGPVV